MTFTRILTRLHVIIFFFSCGDIRSIYGNMICLSSEISQVFFFSQGGKCSRENLSLFLIFFKVGLKLRAGQGADHLSFGQLKAEPRGIPSANRAKSGRRADVVLAQRPVEPAASPPPPAQHTHVPPLACGVQRPLSGHNGSKRVDSLVSTYACHAAYSSLLRGRVT